MQSQNSISAKKSPRNPSDQISNEQTSDRSMRRRKIHPLLPSDNMVARRLGIKPALHCRACNAPLGDNSSDDMCPSCLFTARAQRRMLELEDPEDAPQSYFSPKSFDYTDLEYLGRSIARQGCVTPDINYILDIEGNVVWDSE